MLSDLFYPLVVLFSLLSQLDIILLWGLFIISVGINFYLFRQNQKLRVQQQQVQKKTIQNNSSKIIFTPKESSENKGKIKEKPRKLIKLTPEVIPEVMTIDDQVFTELEKEMDDCLLLDDTEREVSEPEIKSSRMHGLMQSLSGWHKSLVPFLLQNIGWFIGVLCFISGSIFFISYTEGFNKSVTIFYTVLSYTLLLAWGGYRLKDKVSNAAMSGYVLMATSFLLTPLNFTAAAQLLGSSVGMVQFLISSVSVLIALGSLYYTSRLISGLFNRQLLNYFSPVFFTLSCLQLLVPWVQQSQNIILLMAVQMIILGTLLWALINYLPALLKQVFIDRQYLLVMSVSSLIYAALVSAIHITLSSSLNAELSYYAPVILLLSGALFFMDGQLNDYKEQMKLLSYFSFIAYAVSLIALVLSFDIEPIRYLTLFLAVLLYIRLIWLYRSLVPLYLVFILLGFLQFDLILSGWLPDIPGVSSARAPDWFFLASLPLLAAIFWALKIFRKSEIQQTKNFNITRHLFHFLMIIAISLSTYSQWHIAVHSYIETSGFLLAALLNLANSLAIIIGSYYLLKSKQLNACELVGGKFYSSYLYLLLILPVMHILFGFQGLLSMEIKLVLICLMIFFYSLNSSSDFVLFYADKENDLGEFKNRIMNRELFINASIAISLLLLVIVSAGYSVSIENALLIFVVSLNFLFLSLSLLNRALFYLFLLIVSAAILTIKLYLSHSPSTGLLVISSAMLIFYFIHWLDNKRRDEVERIKLDNSKQNNPDKLLGFYPVNDFYIKNKAEEMNHA